MAPTNQIEQIASLTGMLVAAKRITVLNGHLHASHGAQSSREHTVDLAG
jgi:hypothetical protein